MIYVSRVGEFEERIVSLDELKKILESLAPIGEDSYEICELVDIDDKNDMHFEINSYSVY